MVDTDDTRRTIHDRRRTTPGVWHKLPPGKLKKSLNAISNKQIYEYTIHFEKILKMEYSNMGTFTCPIYPVPFLPVPLLPCTILNTVNLIYKCHKNMKIKLPWEL